MAGTEPLNIGVRSAGGGRSELILEFTEAFRGLPVEQQASEFGAFQRKLAQNLSVLRADSPEYGWLLLVQQVADQLAAYIGSGELDMSEPLMVEVGEERPEGFSIMDFLR